MKVTVCRLRETLGILSLLLATTAVAAEPLNYQDKAALNWLIDDHPAPYAEQIRRDFESLNRQSDPPLYVRTVFVFFGITRKFDQIPALDAKLERALGLAQAHDLHEEYLDLLFWKIRVVEYRQKSRV